MRELSLPTTAVESNPLLRRFAPGFLLVLGLAAAAMLLGQVPWLANHGLSALTLAIVLGIIVGNTRYAKVAATYAPGVNVIKHYFLRAGIILYGLRLTYQDLAAAGAGAMVLDALMLISTFALACWLGTRWLKLDRSQVMLIGAGSSICGAAAVLATAPVVRANATQVAVAVSTVVVFGTCAMFLLPALYQLSAGWGWVAVGSREFGLFLGATVHEVAQVVAAGRAIDVVAMDAAVIAKMGRVMMLAPFLMALALYLSRESLPREAASAERPDNKNVWSAMPWFAVAFVALVLVNSLVDVPATWQPWIVQVDTFLLAAAMVALGLTTHFSAIKRAGLKPLLLAAMLALWLILGGAGLAALVLG